MPTMSGLTVRKRDDALQQGARKKPTLTDPLVHHGRHFGRVVHAFCNVHALIGNGLLQLEGPAPDDLSARAIQEQAVFRQLLKHCPDLEERILKSSADELEHLANLIQKGINGARADDTKGMKAAIIHWITPPGQNLIPLLDSKVKTTRGFNHERTGALLCPAGLDWSIPHIKEKLRNGEIRVLGDQWPIFLYADLAYDPEDPWNGLLRNHLLVAGFKHVFTSPSSVEDTKATRSGNAYIHGMTMVTKASLAYITTQVRFALSSTSTFSRNDSVTDSETFYTSVLNLLEDPEEQTEVEELLSWWNRKIFPSYFVGTKTAMEGSALSRIKEKRRQQKEAQTEAGGNVSTSSVDAPEPSL